MYCHGHSKPSITYAATTRLQSSGAIAGGKGIWAGLASLSARWAGSRQCLGACAFSQKTDGTEGLDLIKLQLVNSKFFSTQYSAVLLILVIIIVTTMNGSVVKRGKVAQSKW